MCCSTKNQQTFKGEKSLYWEDLKKNTKGDATILEQFKFLKNKENARKFMEFYLNPENPALNTAQQLNISANAPSRDLLADNLKNNPYINPPSEAYEKLQIFDDLGQDIKIYDREWTKVKAQ